MDSSDSTIGMKACAFLPGHCLARRYRIVEELGTGGMGSVYRAHDLELDEEVAVKVIRPEIATHPEAVQRFSRELKLARRISHRHVVRMYELMEDGGMRFIVMEYVPGESLRSVIRHNGRLDACRAVAVARQVCEGLAAAHRLGVIHRDLKPGNIMIDGDGNARILDFGLARSFAGGEITVAGAILGTPGYMAPEQAMGLECDHRADIFAVGVLLGEMLTGEPPLSPAWHALLARARGGTGGLAGAGSSGIPDSLVSVLAACLETDPARRYQGADELEAHLGAIVHTGTATDVAPPARPASLFSPKPRGTEEHSVAVLPFADMSQEKSQEYFCDGIADELISKLAAIKDLHVAARGSSFCFKGQATDIREIGRRLNVGAVLEGSVRKSGKRLRITAQLINVANGYQLWAESYDRELAEIFAIQDEVTGAIIEHLKLSLLPHEQQAVFKRATEDIDAHNQYLRGLHYLWAYSSTGFREAIDCFERAIARDARYALAHWGLADAYLQMAFWGNTPPTQACEKVKFYARKALEIDPSLGNAHGALSYAYAIHDWNWPAAEREAREAVRLSPSSAIAHAYYSWVLLNTERFEQGFVEATEVLKLDPDTSFIIFAASLGFMFSRRSQRAIDLLRAGIAANPGFYMLHQFLGDAYCIQGQHQEALAALEKAVELSGRAPYIVGRLGMAYQQCKNIAAAEAILQELEKRAVNEHIPPVSFFQLHLVRGNLRQALRWLERAGKAHDSYLGWMRVFPWEGLRAPGDSKLKAKAKKAFIKFIIGRVIRRYRIIES